MPRTSGMQELIPPAGRMGLRGALRAHAAPLSYQVRFATTESSALTEALATDLELALGEWHQIDLAPRTVTEEFSERFESVSEGVCQVAQTGSVTRVNAAFAVLLGYHSPAHLLGEAPAFAGLLLRPEAPNLTARVAAGETVRQCRLRLQRREGEVLDVLADAHAHRSPGGGFVGVNLMFGPGGDRTAGPRLGGRVSRASPAV